MPWDGKEVAKGNSSGLNAQMAKRSEWKVQSKQ